MNELNRLITAIEFNKPELFQGDIHEETLEALRELRELRELRDQVETIKMLALEL